MIVEVLPAGDVVTYGWREPLRISTTLSSEFPELAQVPDHARMLRDDVRQRAELLVAWARAAPLGALVWVEQGATDRLTPLAPSEALVELVSQSAWVLIADGGSPAHLDALRRIAVSVPSFRLTHTPAQLHRIGHTLTAALTPT